MKARFQLLRTILWLRWRLSRNQVRKTGWLAQIMMVLVTIFAVGGVLGAGAGGFMVGGYVLSEGDANVIMYVADAVVLLFLFVWSIGLVADVQRSETIDLQRLMHLPVKLRDAFVVNYVASHVSISLGLALPAVSGLGLGLAWARDPRWLLLPVLFVAFVFAVSAWTYCVRGWLVQLMVNPRRRRWIVIVLTAFIILLVQVPNLFFNVYLRGKDRRAKDAVEQVKARMSAIEEAHAYLPPLWVGWGTLRASQGNWWPAAGALILFGGAGALGLRRAYRSTVRFYRGDQRVRKPSTTIKPPQPVAATGNSAAFLERRLPWVSDEVAAATMAFLRSMQRAPELKMAMLGPVLMLAFMGFMIFSRDLGGRIQQFVPLMALGLTVFALTGALQILMNQFGWDRHGFRALVLSPVKRRDLLIAKNLASGLLIAVVGGLMFAGVGIMVKLSLWQHLAGQVQVLTATLIFCGVGNYCSIVLPFRVSAGSLKPTKPPFKVVLAMMGITLLTPFYMLPVFAGPTAEILVGIAGSPWAPAANLLVSLGMLAVLFGIYWLTLRPLSRLLAERELRILDTVTAEVE